MLCGLLFIRIPGALSEMTGDCKLLNRIDFEEIDQDDFDPPILYLDRS